MNFMQKRYFGLTRDTGGDIAEVDVLPKPPVKSESLAPKITSPIRIVADIKRAEMMDEYAALAMTIGVAAPDLVVEQFKDWLRVKDWPIFSLAEVIKYMDDKAKKESKEQSGWEWRPLRAKDHVDDLKWGVAASRTGNRSNRDIYAVAASDHYAGPHDVTGYHGVGGGGGGSFADSNSALQQMAFAQLQSVGSYSYRAESPNRVYDKLIPLHALRKVSIIENEFKGRVAFFVCDYALAPHIEYPDPFLLAVVPNSKVGNGTGRFVIDFWDEPGFGLENQLA